MNRKKEESVGQPSIEQQQSAQLARDASGCMLRVYWMLFGNLFVVVAAFYVVQGEGVLTVRDLVFWLLALSLIAVRYVDIHYKHGSTAEGQPATLQHWHGYALKVLGISLPLWLATKALGRFVEL